jgi:hypothetical protein
MANPKVTRSNKLIGVARGFGRAVLPMGVAILMTGVYGREYPVLWLVFPALVIFGLVRSIWRVVNRWTKEGAAIQHARSQEAIGDAVACIATLLILLWNYRTSLTQGH